MRENSNHKEELGRISAYTTYLLGAMSATGGEIEYPNTDFYNQEVLDTVREYDEKAAVGIAAGVFLLRNWKTMYSYLNNYRKEK